ncbi:rust resistance kinase Lr10 [Cinnamomum micranthum f. kanehirae]|uniref:Rust resistance kinase Lr10 n=1 Tax=Cinnamomum micranthum f. kanehirae TaxID=337451 RepID=A0A3S3QSU8_9MAGN|nr:rust resistance kinase Lr10 [Cinnamomum micranthum f. kanehirae]
MALHKQETLPHLHHTTRTDWGLSSIPSMSTYMLIFLNHLFLLLLSAKCDGYFRSEDACLPFNCGEFSNVQFPFHEFSSPECRLPDFELLCTEENGVRLLIANRSFEVKSISLSERLVLVADSQLIDVVANKSYCNLPAPFNESELGFFHRSQYNGYVEFMFCFPWFTGGSATLATCGGNHLVHRYIISDSTNLPEYCRSMGKFPIQKKSVKEPGNQLEVILRDGFYLTWPWFGECTICKQNGGRCGHNPDDGKFSCLYSSHVPFDKVLKIIGVCLITILVLAAISAYMKKRSCRTNAEGTPNVEDFLKDYKAQMPTRYSYADIRKMTNCFSQKLGQGGYGGVYKGALTNDIYSYGVLILEAVGKMKLGDMEVENPSPMYIPVWVYDQFSQGRILETGEMTEDEEKILKKMAIVGLWCIQSNPVHRPCINMVIQMLEGDVETLQMPPRPFPSPEERERMLFCSEITNKNELPNNRNSTDN